MASARDDQPSAAAVISLEEAGDLRVAADNGRDDAGIEDEWRGCDLTHRRAAGRRVPPCELPSRDLPGLAAGDTSASMLTVATSKPRDSRA